MQLQGVTETPLTSVHACPGSKSLMQCMGRDAYALQAHLKAILFCASLGRKGAFQASLLLPEL